VSKLKNRARHARAQIADILRHDWNPIGLAPEVPVQDEYDGYVGEVYTLLTMDPSARQLAQYLSKLEAHSLGFRRTDPEALIPVAEKLLAVDVPRRTLTLKSPAREVLQAIVTTFVAVILALIAFGKPMRLTSVVIVLAAGILAAIAMYHAVDQVLQHRRGGPAA
jgi:hypothetical protein